LNITDRLSSRSIDKFLILAGNAEHFDGNASVAQALAKLGLKDQFDLIPGMEISLMAHQAIGVSWMVEKEKSALKGGCIADDMGLGKVRSDAAFTRPDAHLPFP
jgi:SNF2 family DNA or RNA helicase